VLGNQSAADVAQGIDVVLTSFAVNVHGDPQNASTDGGRRRLGELGGLLTGVFSVKLKSASTASEMQINSLPEPIIITIPRPAASSVSERLINCTNAASCSDRGACVLGGCVCESPWYGDECESQSACYYWDEAQSIWATEGCEMVAEDESSISCACTHLTDFAGIASSASSVLPTTKEEVAEDLEEVTFNTFSTEDIVNVLSKPPIEENQTVYTLVFALTGACVGCLLLAFAKDRYDDRRAARLESELSAKGSGVHIQPTAEDFSRAPVTRADVAANYVEAKLDGIDEKLKVMQQKAVLGFTRKRAVALAKDDPALARELMREAANRITTIESASVETAADATAADATAADAAKPVGFDNPPTYVEQKEAAPRAKKERLVTRAVRAAVSALESDHTILGLWYSRDSEIRRPQLVQILFNVIALEIMIMCLLYNEDASPDINLLVIVINGVICAAITAPALVLMKLVWSFAYEKPMPLLNFLGGAMRQLIKPSAKTNRVEMIKQTGAGGVTPLGKNMPKQGSGKGKGKAAAPAAATISVSARSTDRGSAGGITAARVPFPPTASEWPARSGANAVKPTAPRLDPGDSGDAEVHSFKCGSQRSVTAAKTALEKFEPLDRRGSGRVEDPHAQAGRVAAASAVQAYLSASNFKRPAPRSPAPTRLTTSSGEPSGAASSPYDAPHPSPPPSPPKPPLRVSRGPPPFPTEGVRSRTSSPSRPAPPREVLRGVEVHPAILGGALQTSLIMPDTPRFSDRVRPIRPATLLSPPPEKPPAPVGLEPQPVGPGPQPAGPELQLDSKMVLRNLSSGSSLPVFSPRGPPGEGFVPPVERRVRLSMPADAEVSGPKRQMSHREGRLSLDSHKSTLFDFHAPVDQQQSATIRRTRRSTAVMSEVSSVPIPESQKELIGELIEAQAILAERAVADGKEVSVYEMSPSEMRELWRAFAKFDKDRSGSLRSFELRLFMRRIGMPLSNEQATSMLDELDSNDTGDIDFSELLTWYCRRMQEFAEYEAKRRQNRSRLCVTWEDQMKLPKLAKVAIAWLVNWAMFAVFALITTVLAVNFGEERFNAIITSWAVSLSQTFAAEEPVMIWVYLLIPWLIESISHNEFFSELLASFLGSAVGQCVSSVFGFCGKLGQ